MAIGLVGLNTGGLLEIAQGFRVFRLGLPRETSEQEGSRVFRVELDRLGEIGDRLIGLLVFRPL